MEAPKKHPLSEMVLTESSTYTSKLWANHQMATGAYRERLRDFYKQYRGIPNRKNYTGLANVFVNETLEACESIVAQIIHTLFAEPRPVLVQGREETDDQKAKIVENLMEYYFDLMGFKAKILRQLRQNVKYGTTVARVCWCFEEKDITQRTKEGISQNKKITKNFPDLEYIDLLDAAFDPGKPDIDKMDWIIIRKRCPWDYVKDRERRGLYAKEQVLKIKRDGIGTKSTSRDRKKNMREIGINYYFFDDNLYEILEYWGKVPRWWVDDTVDIKDDSAGDMVEAVMEVVLNGPTLRLEPNPYWHQEKPFAMAQFIQVDDEAPGMGVCEITESLQQELNDKRNQLLDHATEQIAPPLIINRNASINDADIELKPFKKIKSDLPGDQSITPLRLGGNPLENVQMDNIIKQDIRNQTGANNVVQGISSSSDKTAFEISQLQSRGSSRIDISTVDFSEKFLKRVYRLMYAMIQQYVDKPTAVRIVGKDGIKWEQVGPEDVACDYDLIPKVSTDASNRSIIRGQMIQFVTQLGPLYPKINLYKAIHKIYSLFGFEDTDEIIPEPDTEIGNKLTIDEEIQVLAMGQKLDVKFYEDHMNKLQMFLQFEHQFGKQLTPQGQAALKDAINQHMTYLKVLEQAQGMAGAGPLSVVPGAPAGAGAPPAKKPQGQGPVARSAQAHRDLTRTGG